jgi:phytoene desaturase
MSAPHALVIGAGLGALAAAARLRHRGYRVTVVERHGVPGGRCGLWESEGFRFDTGPTLLLMVDYLRALFRDLGRRLEDYLDLVQLEPSYRVHYADGRTLDVTSRINRMLEEVERIEPGAGPALLRFLAETARLYRIGLDGSDCNVHRRAISSARNAGLLAGRDGAVERMAGRFFRSEALRHTFSFRPLPGLSRSRRPPSTASATGRRPSFPRGDARSPAPRRLAGAGVTIRYGGVPAGAPGRRVAAAITADGSRLPADLVLATPTSLRVPEPLGELHRGSNDCLGCPRSAYLGVNRRCRAATPGGAARSSRRLP